MFSMIEDAITIVWNAYINLWYTFMHSPVLMVIAVVVWLCMARLYFKTARYK